MITSPVVLVMGGNKKLSPTLDIGVEIEKNEAARLRGLPLTQGEEFVGTSCFTRPAASSQFRARHSSDCKAGSFLLQFVINPSFQVFHNDRVVIDFVWEINDYRSQALSDWPTTRRFGHYVALKADKELPEFSHLGSLSFIIL